MLYKKLSSKFANYIKKIASEAVNDNKSGNLKHIQTLKNVHIAPSVVLGENTQFEVQGTCKEISFEARVSTRRFCNFLVYDNASLIIHHNVFFNNFCSVNCLGSIEIGSDTIFGEGVKLYDHNHLYSYDNQKQLNVHKNQFKIGFIKIGNSCWIGSNVTILNNVEIGDNVIVGANTLVYQSIPSNTIVKHKEDLIMYRNE